MDKETLDHISNVLRLGTVTWSGRSECLRRARRYVIEGQTKKGKPVRKLHWQCATCMNWFRNESDMEVDHIIEIGKRPSSVDELLAYIKRMYCEQDNLQALCVSCHLKKTGTFVASQKFTRKVKGE